jgi:hypothetical protein
MRHVCRVSACDMSPIALEVSTSELPRIGMAGWTWLPILGITAHIADLRREILGVVCARIEIPAQSL